MLDCNRVVRKKMTALGRGLLFLIPLACMVILLTQTVFAKNTYLIRDGGRLMFHTTYATDPATVIGEAGLALGAGDTYTTQPGIGLSEIKIQRKQNIRVVIGGKASEVTSYGETVESLLNRMNFTLTENDVVSVSLSAQTYDGMTVTISHTKTGERVYTEAVPFSVTYCYDSSIPNGEQVVLTQGKEGAVECRVRVFYVNGQAVSETVLSRTVIEQPVDELIAIGTYVEPTDEPVWETEPPPTEPEPETEPTVPPTEPPTEPPKAPAQSSNNNLSTMPTFGEGTITLPSGEVLTYTHKEVFRATAYCPADVGGQVTALGTPTRVGAIAVDPSVIPYGTKMFIVSQDGQYIYGVAVAEDCGKSIKGNRIDLFYETDSECVKFGIRDCDVYFLG